MQLKNRKRFILSNLEMRLDYEFSPALIHETLKRQSLPDLQHLLMSDSAEAIQALKDLKYEVPGGNFVTICQHNYSDLFRMRDRLQLMEKSEIFKDLNEEALSFYEGLGNAVGRVIKHLEGLGIRSLAPAELLPDYFRESRQEIMRQQVNIFHAKCKSKSIDPELTGLLLHFFQDSCATDDFTQKALHYSEELMTALLAFLSKQREGNPDPLLMFKLLQLNYNCPLLYNFYRKQLRDRFATYEDSSRKLLALKFDYKKLKQMLPKPGMAMNPDAPELKCLLLDYLREEIKYLKVELEDQAAAVVPELAEQPGHVSSPEPDHLDLNVSMRVLAYFIRVLVQRKTIPLGNDGIKAKLAFFAKHVRTLSGEQLSVDSLSKRYSEVNATTIEAVREMLVDMLRMLDADSRK